MFNARNCLLFPLLMSATRVSQAFVALSPSALHLKRPLTSSTSLHSQSAQDAIRSTEGNKFSTGPIQAVLFDVDGTLADSWKLGFDATQVVLERNNIPRITEEIYHAGTRYSTPARLARHAGYQPGDADYESIGQKLGQEFDDFYVSLVSLETAKFYPGIESLLQQIPPNVKLGALTNAAVRYADAVLQCNCPVYRSQSNKNDEAESKTTAAIYTRFGSIRGADNVPQPKPAPDGLLTVCQDLKVDPQNCVYVGDSPTDGMAARAANMRAVGVTWGSHKKTTLMDAFDHICDSVTELEELLLELVVSTTDRP